MPRTRFIRGAAVAIVMVGALLTFQSDAQARMVPECQEGGLGSPYCEIGGCSVSCSSGYYACCNLTDGCKCAPGGGEL